jgi:hypothetical protein
MKRYVFSPLVGFYFLIWSVIPVSADWEFTKWGMSPEQVVQASKGQAHPAQDDISSILLTQDWQSGRFLFVVSYVFENTAGRQGLSLVKLQLKNTEVRDKLLSDLKRKYGRPVHEEKGHINLVAWKKSGDSIHYLTDLESDTILYERITAK